MKRKICSFLMVLALVANPVFTQENKPPPIPENPSRDLAVVSLPSAPKVEKSDKVSLDIKGMDVVEVLKMLSSRYGLNIVVGKNVSGKVTLFLKDVEVWDAFEILIAANDLAYEKKGAIINVMTQRDYEMQYGDRYKNKKEIKTIQLKYAKAQDLAKVLTQMKTNIGKVIVDDSSNTVALVDTPDSIKSMEDFIASADMPIQTRIFSLSYSQAEKVGPKIQELVTKGVGSVKTDERTNKIAVTDYPKRLNELGNIIKAFDEKPQQVLVDAQIIQVNPTERYQMGVDWDYWLRKNYRLAVAMPGGTSMARLLVGIAASSIGGSPSDPGQYKAIIDLLKTIGDIRILSSPRIMVLNNQEAKIHVGKIDKYLVSTVVQPATGSATIAQDPRDVKSGITLAVTPTISRDGFVTMKIKPEISEATLTTIVSAGVNTTVPTETVSEIESTVIVKDGVTLIIAGLRKDKDNRSEKRIPLLGDIPLIGKIFSNVDDQMEKQEIIILLTPHIISGESSYTDFSEIKPKVGAVVRMSKKGIITKEMIDTISEEYKKEKESANLDKTTDGEKSADIAEQEFPAKESAIFQDETSRYQELVRDNIIDGSSRHQPVGEVGEIVVFFTLTSDGQLKGEPKVVASNNENLNSLALKTVKNSSPFPCFPESMIESEEEDFQVIIQYE